MFNRDEILKVAKPILYNTEMVKAILEGGKTCTRRVLKPQPQGYIDFNNEFPAPAYIDTFAANGEHRRILARYQPCDYLYVRETWRVGAWDVHRQLMAFDYKDGTCGEDARKAGCEYNGVDFVWEKGKSPCRWKPSIHMPKEAARIFLRVKNVRVEKLQDITLEDAFNEGIMFYKGWESEEYIKERKEAIKNGTKPPIGYAPLERFIHLWNSTIPREKINIFGWDANPWVWVYEFEKAEVEE